MNPKTWFDENGSLLISRCREVFGKAPRPERFTRHDDGCWECYPWQQFLATTALEAIKAEDFYKFGSPADLLTPEAIRYLMSAIFRGAFSSEAHEVVDMFMLWELGDPSSDTVRDFSGDEVCLMGDFWATLSRSFDEPLDAGLKEWERPYGLGLEHRIRTAAKGWHRRVKMMTKHGSDAG